MDIQTIRSLQKQKPEFISLQIMTTSTPTSPSLTSSPRSSWRKFASDTPYRYEEISVDVNADIEEFYDQMQRAWDNKQYDQVLKGLDVVLERHWAAMNSVIRATIFVLKSKCYEEMNEIDFALKEMDNVFAEIKNHEATIDEFIDVLKRSYFEIDYMNYMQLRKAGLLLLNGKEEEAFQVLRDNQPTQISAVLLVHLVEQECNLSLLEPKPASDEDDLTALFLAGRYEEVIEKTKTIKPVDSRRPFCIDPTPIRLHAAALVMMGRAEEALQYFHEMERDHSFREDEIVYSLIQVLNGDQNSFENEFTLECPVELFAKWLLNRGGLQFKVTKHKIIHLETNKEISCGLYITARQ